jgi:hypothetical protein
VADSHNHCFSRLQAGGHCSTDNSQRVATAGSGFSHILFQIQTGGDFANVYWLFGLNTQSQIAVFEQGPTLPAKRFISPGISVASPNLE